MDVRLLEATEDPEELICRAARNDYMSEFVADQSFTEVMESIEGESIEDKQETLIGHLLSHGHFGPFEHPQATFAIEGVSRTTVERSESERTSMMTPTGARTRDARRDYR